MRSAAFGQKRVGVMLVLAAASLWSTGGVGVKTAEAEPLVIAGLRSAFALVFMAGVLAFSRIALRDVPALLGRPLVWCAAASYALMVTMFVLSARRTTAANAIFIQYTGPVYVALLSGKLLGERPTARDAFAVAGSIIGLGLTFGGELGGGRTSGNLLAILSSFGFAGLPLLLRIDQKKLERGRDVDARSARDVHLAPHAPLVAMVLGNALAALVALPAIVEHPPQGEHQARTWAVLVLLGFFQIGLPYVLYGIAVRRLRALESSLLATIEPVLAPIWVLLATGERPTLMAALGGGVIVVAIASRSLGAKPVERNA